MSGEPLSHSFDPFKLLNYSAMNENISLFEWCIVLLVCLNIHVDSVRKKNKTSVLIGDTQQFCCGFTGHIC